MHEASLMANLMDRIHEIAREEKAQRVVGVSVWLGALSHMSESHFIEHFEQAAAAPVGSLTALQALRNHFLAGSNSRIAQCC